MIMSCLWCGTKTECDCDERIYCDHDFEPPHLGCGVCRNHFGAYFQCLGRCGHWPRARVFRVVNGTATSSYVDGWYAQLVPPDETVVGPRGDTALEAWEAFNRIRQDNGRLPVSVDERSSATGDILLAEWVRRFHERGKWLHLRS